MVEELGCGRIKAKSKIANPKSREGRRQEVAYQELLQLKGFEIQVICSIKP
jgi:hypothetical protein